MAMPTLKRQDALRIPSNVGCETKEQLFNFVLLKDQLEDIDRCFCIAYGDGLYKLLQYGSETRKKLCFGCELEEDSDHFSPVVNPHYHRCTKSAADLFREAAERIWVFLDQYELKKQWFKEIEKAGNISKEAILHYFRLHFNDCRGQFMRPKMKLRMIEYMDEKRQREIVNFVAENYNNSSSEENA